MIKTISVRSQYDTLNNTWLDFARVSKPILYLMLAILNLPKTKVSIPIIFVLMASLILKLPYGTPLIKTKKD